MRQVVVTKDGSHTIAIPEKGVFYHSVHGAMQESKHVYVEEGLRYVCSRLQQPVVSVFEMGFGTGLNAFLTAIEAGERRQKVWYTTVETTPLPLQEVLRLNYPDTPGQASLFQQLHHCAWNDAVVLNEFFTLQKLHTSLTAFSPSRLFHLIYYDAFAPSAQPELWTKEIFQLLLSLLHKDGVLVTYCAKGDVHRAMKAAGFTVEKRPGPKWKREILRATNGPVL